MNKLKLVSIVGARPQFIKMAAIHRVINKYPAIEHSIIHTAQHYDPELSAIFFKELDLPEPDHILELTDISLSASINRMKDGIYKVLRNEKPAMVLVYGDTNSTLAAALAANELIIPIAHIEAGLRSYDMSMPEERNRIETDKLSTLLFCPSEQAVRNLVGEGYSKETVLFSGDVMFDSILQFLPQAYKEYDNSTQGKFVLVSIHRQSTVRSPEVLQNIIQAFNYINSDTRIIFPVHPGTLKAMEATGQRIEFELSPPVGYLQMLSLLSNCSLVVTDSGGLQKEAYFCKKMCVTVRDNTEWTELVAAGVNIIAGTAYQSIIQSYERAKCIHPSFTSSFYGDGQSAGIIVDKILKFLEVRVL